jgi:tRNA pseudouridine38-40 synthase
MLGMHDFWSFCKHERGKSTLGELKQAKISGRKILTFDFVAPAFLWQQVRRMVSALLSVGVGKLNLRDFKRMLEQRQGQLPSPAPPEGLVLTRVDYRGVDFRSNRRRSAKFANLLKRIRSRISIATAK